MTDFYEWLENARQLSYAPTSPPYMGPSIADDPTDQIASLDIDDGDNMFIDAPYALQQDAHPEQSTTFVESLPIDPSLTIMPGRTAIMVPEHLAEDGSRLIIHLLRTMEKSEDVNVIDDNVMKEMTFTAEELEILEPIPEEDFGPPIPSAIDGICVNMNPHPTEIKDVIDFKRTGRERRTFYLAKSSTGSYYWFCSPHTECDDQLAELIKDYRRKSRTENVARKTRGVKKLRSGRTIRI